ncbi:hypothetical protein [Nocardioides nanhaiensis]|uniref:DUF1795 domain-containing protein n=1 Tax=Nocardioides nanhaiensis TaxID=1476871 RepID=A0ABP8W4A6_9ACTN
MNQPPPPPPGSGPDTPPGQGWGAGDQPPPPPPGQQPWPPQEPTPTQPMATGGQPGQPYGQGGYPQQPGQPLGQGGFPPPGQQPPKKKTGLIIGGVVGAIAVIAIIVGVTLAVTGDDDEGDEPRADESSQEADSSDEPTDEPTDSASEDSGAGGDDGAATEAPAPDGSTLQGTGYSYSLPEGWQDISADVTGANPGTFIDTAASWGPSIEEGRGNVIVENPPAGGADSAEALEQLRTNFTSQFPDAEIDDTDPRTIGGEEMLGLELTRTNEAGVEVDQEAYVAVIDDVAYIITASSTADDDGAEDQFEQIYDSWTFE